MRDVALAYLLGAYLSDGSPNWDRTDLNPVWYVTDRSFADCIVAALDLVGTPHSLLPLKCSPPRKDKWRVAALARNELGNWLCSVSGAEKEKLPKIPDELVRPLVAGLMDGDGCVSRDSAGFRLSYSGSKGFVSDFHDLLSSCGVRPGKYGGQQFGINLESFLATGLNFAMPRKQDCLASWCYQVTKTATRRGNSDDLRRAAVAKWWMQNVYNSLLGSDPADGRYYIARLAGRRTFEEVQRHNLQFPSLKGV